MLPYRMYGIEQTGGLWHGNRVSLSYRQERISELCSQIIATDDPLDWPELVSELRAALAAQLTSLRNMVHEAKLTIGQLPPDYRVERRKAERRKAERRESRHKEAAG
jgi:hypothetical protein